MKIGVLSDTHGRADTVEMALAEFRGRGVELVIHCGDIDDAATVRAFAGWTTHFVYGNCDGDRAGIRRAIESIGATLHDPFGHLELAGKQIAWLHGDKHGCQHDTLDEDGHPGYVIAVATIVTNVRGTWQCAGAIRGTETATSRNAGYVAWSVSPVP